MLAAGFGELAAQLGARDLSDIRDPVASVHGALAGYAAGWILIFDNAADLASVAAFLPPAGPGQVLITSQNSLWPPAQALEVAALDTGVAAEFLINRTSDPDRQAAAILPSSWAGCLWRWSRPPHTCKLPGPASQVTWQRSGSGGQPC